MSTLQFLIPRPAADALPIEEMKRSARMAGVSPAQFEYSTKNADGQYRITCGAPVARFLVEQLRQLAAVAEKKGDASLLKDCERGVAAGMAEMERDEREGSLPLTAFVDPSPY